MAVVGVDIGGTNIRVSLFIAPGAIADGVRLSTRAWGWPLPLDSLAERLNGQIAQWEVEYGQIDNIGFAIASVVDPVTGYIDVAENLGWKDLPFLHAMRARMEKRILVDSDAACGALAEAKIGCGKDHPDFLYIVVGTGIGHSVVINGAVRHGMRNSANAFGHIKVVTGGEPCYCGGTGCLCQYASGQAIARMGAKARGVDRVTEGEVEQAYLAGEEWAVSVVEQWMDIFALPVANALNLLDLDLVVLGGGVIREDFPRLTRLQEKIEALLYPEIAPLSLNRSALGDQSVVIGAAQLAFDRLSATL